MESALKRATNVNYSLINFSGLLIGIPLIMADPNVKITLNIQFTKILIVRIILKSTQRKLFSVYIITVII